MKINYISVQVNNLKKLQSYLRGNIGEIPEIISQSENNSIVQLNKLDGSKKYCSLSQTGYLTPKFVEILRQEESIMIATKTIKTINSIFARNLKYRRKDTCALSQHVHLTQHKQDFENIEVLDNENNW